MSIACLVGTFAAAAPASAGDVCVQFSGITCALSGDLGFFRFTGAKFPTSNKKAVRLHGRACGTGTATGTLVMTHDSSLIELGATFICDATPGVISVEFSPASTGIGSSAVLARASYGTYDLSSSCLVSIVDCATEP
jgi:hypothetical protein